MTHILCSAQSPDTNYTNVSKTVLLSLALLESSSLTTAARLLAKAVALLTAATRSCWCLCVANTARPLSRAKASLDL